MNKGPNVIRNFFKRFSKVRIFFILALCAVVMGCAAFACVNLFDKKKDYEVLSATVEKPVTYIYNLSGDCDKMAEGWMEAVQRSIDLNVKVKVVLGNDWVAKPHETYHTAFGTNTKYFPYGQIYINTGMDIVIDLNGHNLDRALTVETAYNNGRVIVADYGNLVIEDSSVEKKGAITGGCTWDAASVAGNGGGIYIAYANVTMNSGNIKGNRGNLGGGVGNSVSNGGTFTLNGGYVSENIGRIGGGLHGYMNIVINGGVISGNTNHGIYVDTTCRFKMHGGSIIDNTGDGINVHVGNDDMEFTGGTISNNTGWGISVANDHYTGSPVFKMAFSGAITNNKAGGVRGLRRSEFNFSGSPKIYNNGPEGKLNLYFYGEKAYDDAGNLMDYMPIAHIVGKLNAGTYIGVSGRSGAPTVYPFIDGYTENGNTEAEISHYFFPDNNKDYEIKLNPGIDNNGDTINDVLSTLQLVAKSGGGTATSDLASKWRTVATNGGTLTLDRHWVAEANTTFGTSFGGASDTSTDISSAFYKGSLCVPAGKTVTLDLNGFTLDRALNTAKNEARVFNVQGTLIIQDGSNNNGGNITGGNSGTHGGGAIYIGNGGIVTLQAGTISGNIGSSGGAVYAENGTFTMTGGVISNNIASLNGGGVYIKDGTFTMTGGKITQNTATYDKEANANGYGGGVFVASTGTLNLSGTAYISGNYTTRSVANSNIYLPINKTITINGAISAGFKAGITMGASTGIFTTGFGAKNPNLVNSVSTYFSSDNDSYEAVYGSGEAQLGLLVDAPIALAGVRYTGSAVEIISGINSKFITKTEVVSVTTLEGEKLDNANPTILSSGVVTATAVADYKLKFTLADGFNWKSTRNNEPLILTGTVNRINIDVPVLNAETLKYTGGNLTTVASGFDATKMSASLTYTSFANDTTTSTVNAFTVKDAGTYVYTFKLTDGNYQWGNNTTGTGVRGDFVLPKTVEQATLTAPAWDNAAFTFNGLQQGATAAYGKDQGVIGSDTVTATLSYNGTEPDGDVYHDSPDKPINAGNYTATVKSISNANYKLSGTLTKDFAIGQFSIADASVTLTEGEFTYNGQSQTKDPTVKVTLAAGETTLTLNDDYTVAYSRTGETGSDTTKAGTVTVTVTAAENSNYKDFATTAPTYVIKQRDLTNVTVAVTSNHTYDGTAQVPTITVTDGAIAITTDDYSITSYGEHKNINAGEVTATLTGASNYTGTKEFTFNIAQRDISVEANGIAFDEIAAVTYNGAAQTPDYTVKYGEYTLVLDKDFNAVTWAENTNAGENTASVTITGIGNFTGNLSKSFTINRAALTLGTAKVTNTDPIYAGQLLSVAVLDQTITATYAAASGVDNTVAGTWSWVNGENGEVKEITNSNADTSVKEFDATYTALFTPTDTNNFVVEGEGVNVQEVSFTAVNLIITVNVTKVDTLGQSAGAEQFKYFIDYGATYTVEDFKATEDYVEVKGFSPFISLTQLSDKVEEVANITKDETVYVRYEAATDTKYYVFHLKQMFGATEADPLKYATLEEIVTLLGNKVTKDESGKITAINIESGDLFLLNDALEPIGAECEIRTGTTGMQVTALDEEPAEPQANTYVVKNSYDGFRNETKPSAKINGDGTTCILPKYSRLSYNLVISANGGKLDETTTTRNETYLFEAKVQDPNLTPTRTGYRFVGWYVGAEGSQQEVNFNTYTMPAAPTTIYAQWEAIPYTLQFNYNEGIDTLLHVNEKEYASDVSLSVVTEEYELVAPTAIGFKFLGWYYRDTNNEEVAVSNISGSIIGKAQVTGNNIITIYAKWQKMSYTLTYNVNGGVGNIPVAYFQYGESVKLDFEVAQQPVRTGYTFLGWNTYESATSKRESYTMPAENTTLYAVWQATEYHIDFTYLGHNAQQQQLIKDVQTAFTAYYGSNLATLKSQPYVSGAQDAELKVNFGAYSVQRDGQITLSRKPEYTGLKFYRWVYYKSENGQKATEATKITRFTDVILSNAYKTTINGEEHVEIFAEWTIPTYTVSFKNNNNNLSTRITVTNLTQYSEYAAKFPVEPKRNGYEFVGWYTQPLDAENFSGYCIGYNESYAGETTEGDVPIRTQVVLDGNVTLYAGWKAIDYKFTLSAKDNENEVGADLALTVNGGEPLDENGDPAKTIDDIVVHTGDRLMLTVTPAAGYRLVSLKVGGEDCNSGSYSVRYGYKKVTVEVGQGEQKEISVIEIEAVVTPVIYRITYTSLEGGSWKQNAEIPTTFTVANYSNDGALGSPLDLPNNNHIERVGYTFHGWYKYEVDENGAPVIGVDRLNTTADFAGQQTETGIADIQLIAKWEAKVQEIKVYANDDNLENYQCFINDIHSNTNKTGDQITIDITLPKGYRLVGFSTTASGKVVYSANLPTTADYSSMSVNYTVRPDNNELYCHWVGEDDLYVLINPSEKDYKFTGTNGKPLTLTATPLTQYTDTKPEAVIYDFTWKKYNEATTQFDTIKTDRVTYDKEKVEGQDPTADSSKKFVASSTLELRNRNDSGLYRCELVVTITSKNNAGEVSVMMVYATNTSNVAGVVKPIGDYDCEVTIGQAKVEGLSMKPATVDYDGKDKKDLIKVLSNSGMVSEDGMKVNLLDGTQATISYVFTKEGAETATTEVIDAGVYTVVANFAMPEDSNYEQINPIEVLLTIKQKVITIVDYTSNLGVNSNFTKAYDGTALTVSASSKEILDRDKDYVTIELLNFSNTDIGDYSASVSKLGAGKNGDRSGNYVLQLEAKYTNCQYSITLATRSELENLDFTSMLGLEGDARKKVVDYDGEGHLLGLDLTGIEIPEEVKWSYTVNYTAHNGIYQEAGSNQIKIKGVTADFAEEGVSGIAAGTYVITVSFTDDDPNYSAKESLTATLVINPATYVIDRTVKDNLGDNFDDIQYATYDPNATSKHHPLINDTKLAEAVANGDISVEYTYERDMRQAGTTEANWQNISVHEGFGGAGSVGEYKLTATITFISDAYVNNYAEIKPIVVTYVILAGEIDRLELHAYGDADGTGAELADGAITGKFNEELNYTQFSLWVFYKNNTHEKLNSSAYYILDNMISKVGQVDGIEAETEGLLEKFTMASNEYVVSFVYSTFAKEYKIKVSPADYKFTGVGIDKLSGGKLTQPYSVEGYAPTVSFSATDVNGDKVNGISTVYQVNGGAWLTAEEVKTALLAAGTYNVKFGYIHTDSNYVGTTATAFKAANGTDDLTCTVEITAQSITEVVWQYNSTGNEDGWTELTKDENNEYKLPYIGKEYTFRALYETGKQSEGGTPVTQVATVSAGEGVVVKDAKNNYSLTAKSEDGNYTISVSALTLEVTPVDVTLGWFVGNDKYDATAQQLKYGAGNDNFTLINVNYTDVDGNVISSKDEASTLTIGVKEMINAGDYELTVTNSDGNYNVTNATLTVTVYGTTVSGATVQYKDAEGNWQDIPAEGLPYKGAKYEFQATYTPEGGQPTTTTNVTVKETKDEILSADTYTLVVGNIGNYYVEIETGKEVLVINKAPLTVTYEQPTYNGNTQALGVTLSGLVGREASLAQAEVIELSETVEAKDVLAEGSSYTIRVTVKDEYFTNYTFANNYQSVDQDWNVSPLVAEFTWAGPNGEEPDGTDGPITMTYTGREQLPEATVSNIVEGEQLSLMYGPGEINVNVGGTAYTATVLSIANGDGSACLNYTLMGSNTADQEYYIKKAQALVQNVKYKEYSIDNTTYNDTALRNDKLVGDAYIMVNGRSIPVEGSFQFTDSTLCTTGLGQAGISKVSYKFVPQDENFNGINGTMNITVQTLKPDRLEVVATETAQTAYTAGEHFKEAGFDVYVIYNNFYEEEGVEHGTKVKFVQEGINQATNPPEYKIGKLDPKEVTLTTTIIDPTTGTAVELDSTTIEVAVSLKYWYKAKPTDSANIGVDLAGTLDITVSRNKVVSISLNENKKPIYYVGEKFDVTQLALNVLYEGATVPKKETENIILVSPTGVFTEVGATSATIRFGTQTLNIPIEVKEKEELPVVFTGRQLQYQNGTAIAIPTATFNGISLPNGVEVDENGKPLTFDDKGNVVGKGIGIIATYKITAAPAGATQLTALGKYTIQVSFVVTNPRYKAHETITAEFEVVEEVVLAELTLVEGSNLELKTESEAKYLTKVAAGATVAEVLGQFEDTSGTIKVLKNNKEISGNTLIGTDCVITLEDASGNTVDSVTVVIKGDVNGDGKVNGTDVVFLNLFIANKRQATSAQKMAADADGNGKVNGVDKVRFNLHIANKKSLYA